MTGRKSWAETLAAAIALLFVGWTAVPSLSAIAQDGPAAHSSPSMVAAAETATLAVDGMT